jgi:hypothetical protein
MLIPEPSKNGNLVGQYRRVSLLERKCCFLFVEVRVFLDGGIALEAKASCRVFSMELAQNPDHGLIPNHTLQVNDRSKPRSLLEIHSSRCQGIGRSRLSRVQFLYKSEHD